jgi:Ca2+-binding EF-hand superfamily protein
MLKQLLHPDPEQRMTSKDFLRHPWIQGLTARDEKMDETYKRHLIYTFKKRISTHFARNGGKEVDFRKIFNSIDVAGNGVLDANEIRMALRSAGESDDIVTKIISSLDLKRQGGKVSGVTFEEFTRIMNEEE